MDPLYGGTMAPIHAIFYIVLGLLFCFSGYFLFKTYLRVYGLLLGFFLGVFLGALTKNAVVAIVVGAIGGIVGCLVMPYILFVGLFITGGTAGALLFALPIAALELKSSAPEVGAAMAGFMLGGIAAVRFEKEIMVFLTALYGVIVAGMGFNGLGGWLHLGPLKTGKVETFEWSLVALTVRIALLLAGIWIQTRLVKRLDKKKPITTYW